MSFLRRLFSRDDPGPTRAAPPPPFDPADVEAYARGLVDQGFLGRDEMIEASIEAFTDVAPEAEIAVTARAGVDAALRDHAAAEATWSGDTDCDRLDRAFARLEAEGIVARQNFACCQTCGHAEIGDEIDDPVRSLGYAFYHQQDTERAADGGGLYIAYGATSDRDRDAPLRVGDRVVAALAAEGLSPVWDRSPATRIAVPMHWQRRRTGGQDDPAIPG